MMHTVIRRQTIPNGARLLALLVSMTLASSISAQEPAPIPETQPSQPPPASSQTDPCAELRTKLTRLTAARKKGVKKLKKTSRHTGKKSGMKRNGKNAPPAPANGKTSTTSPSPCTGAISMKEVREILGTTRDLSGRNLNCLDFTGYDLKGVNFSGATMIATTCTRANMEDTNLERANLTDADLTRVNLHMARLAATTFDNAQLDGALWTDRRPCAPGSIGACRDTFQGRRTP